MESGNFYTDKSIALLVWNTEVEYDAHVYFGRIKKEDEEFVFFVFPWIQRNLRD